MINIELKGFAELEKKLSNIEKKVAKSIVRKGVRQAQNICLREAKQNASSMVGGDMGAAISKAFKTKAIYKQKKGSYQLQVAIDPSKAEQFKHTTKDGKIYYIPTAIEYGHKNVGGGTTPPIPYLRDAAEKTAKARIETLYKEISKGLDNA